MTAQPVLTIHRIVDASRANGPGVRAVVWVQGCTLNCPGCANPETHDPAGGTRVPVAALAERLCGISSKIEGITVSGGEPLQQAFALTALLKEIRRHTRLSILLFSGYTMEEIEALNAGKEVLRLADVLIAGRYDRARRVARGLIASSNQTVHFLTRRYGPADLAEVPEAEVLIGPDGSVLVTGIDTPSLSVNHPSPSAPAGGAARNR